MWNKKVDYYEIYGPYHWDWYGKRVTYTQHVNFLKKWVKEKNTLDIGAGDGLITRMLGVRGVDNNPRAVRFAEGKGAKVEWADALYRLPYKKEEFDSALMSDVVEYFRNITKPLSEARRVIKKYLYIAIPTGARYLQPGYSHQWTADELVTSVEKNRFKLVEGPLVKPDRRHIYFKFEKV